MLVGEIQGAQRGSDVFGLVEKIAYLTHLDNPRNTPEINWESAQNTLFKWAENKYRDFPELRMGFEAIVHDILSHDAYNRHQYRDFWERESRETPFDDWVYAQDQFARQVMNMSSI